MQEIHRYLSNITATSFFLSVNVGNMSSGTNVAQTGSLRYNAHERIQ